MKSKSIVAALITSVLLSFIPLNANAAAKPKCTGKNLASYNKNLRLYDKAYTEYLSWDDPNGFKALNYSDAGLARGRELTLEIWLNAGYAYAKFSKLCKVKIRPEWQQMLDSIPDQ
jgi:hypothetical protein